MALYHKWDVKTDFAYVLQFFSLISDSLGSVKWFPGQKQLVTKTHKRTILDPIYSPVYFIKLKNCIIATIHTIRNAK